MTEEQTRSEKELEILHKVQKLLSVKGRSPEETALYASKAQELMLAYNLDMARLADHKDSGQRAKEKLVGGFYEFQRDLWSRVADLNFCLYWSQWVSVERTQFDRRTERMSYHAQKYRRERQHRLVGRTVNIAATRGMAEYILGAIEHACRDWLGEGRSPGDLRSQRAVSFREGAASEIAGRLWDMRQTQIRDEREAQRRADEQAAMAGVSSSTAITISSLRKTEEDANYDVLYGEGYSARKAAQRAAAAEADRLAREAHTQWAEANPEEARKEAERERKAAARRSTRPRREAREKDRDWGAYSAGYDAGKSISLHQQMEERRAPGLPGR